MLVSFSAIFAYELPKFNLLTYIKQYLRTHPPPKKLTCHYIYIYIQLGARPLDDRVFF